MKSKLFLIWAISVMLAMAASAQSPSQQVTAIQYYFDSPDPGVGVAGNGLVVPVSPSADYLNSSFPIQFPSSPALTNGLHNLYVRAKDQNGSWSITERRTFLIQPLNTTQNVTAVEYYFDNDITGPGTQTPYTIAPSADVNTTINVVIPNTLSNGLHNLYVRVKDNFGRWSIAERRLFLIHHAMNAQTVTALEYYFDADPGAGMGIPLPVTPAADINQTVTFLMPGILAGAHRFYLRAKDNFGRWSIIERALDTAATGVAPSVVTPSGPVAFCQGGSTVLSTVAGQGIGLQWFKDGVLIQDSIFTTLTVTATGNYKVQSSYNGFTAFSNIVAVTVNTPPVITFCTADTSVNSSALNCSRVVNYNPVLASGTPTPSVTYLPPGHTFSVGTTQVVATATGGCTPAATCSFNVTVNDVQSPVLQNCPGNISQCNPVVTWTPPTATDNCNTPPPLVTSNHNSGETFPVGNTIVTYTATDANSNSSACSFTVIITPSIWYADADGDGFGDLNSTSSSCTQPLGYVSNSADCDDAHFTYADVDADGFGAGLPIACGVTDNTDCNDGDINEHPGQIWFLDNDEDDYGAGITIVQCLRPLHGYIAPELTSTTSDCNDSNAAIHPGATEICGNGIDDDCNGTIDNGCTADIYHGGVGDGFASAIATNQSIGASIYFGGNDDGFTSLTASNLSIGASIYLGGNDDGFSSLTASNQSIGSSIYLGGNDDGFASLTAFNQSIGASIYLGGIDDGFASLTASNQSIGASIYLGGAGDGFAFAGAFNISLRLSAPVSRFDAAWQNENVSTQWMTISETNTHHFEVERSIDNSSFMGIGILPAAGSSSSELNYNLIDTSVSSINSDIFYYRLVTVTTGNERSYSAVVILYRAKENTLPHTISIFPNPTHDLLYVAIDNFNNNLHWMVYVFNANENKVFEQPAHSGKETIDLSRISSGIYFLVIVNEKGFKETMKVIVQR